MLTLFRIATDETNMASDGEGLTVPVSTTSMCRLATGRSALYHLIQRLPLPHASTVLLPSYVAEGVIQPFLTAGFTVLFYRLQPNLSPISEDIEASLKAVNGTAVMVLIHYFGFSARSAELSSVLNRHRPVVVEDCAHAMFTKTPSGRALGEDADLALYSLNKFLPVIDGAILISNRHDIDLSLDETILPELPVEAQQAYQNHLQAGRGLFACNDPSQAKYFLQQLGESYERYYAVINNDLSPFCQSMHARCIEDIFPYGQLIKQRLLNTRIFYDGLKSSLFSLVYPTLPSGVVPFCIPARVPPSQRTEIIDKLLQEGIVLSTLQEKWDFVPANQQCNYNVEADFLNEHVLIPISEFISADSMRYLVKQINSV